MITLQGAIEKSPILDDPERHDLKSRFLIFILVFIYPLFLGGRRKGEKNNQSREFKSYHSGSSNITITILDFPLLLLVKLSLYIGKMNNRMAAYLFRILVVAILFSPTLQISSEYKRLFAFK